MVANLAMYIFVTLLGMYVAKIHSHFPLLPPLNFVNYPIGIYLYAYNEVMNILPS